MTISAKVILDSLAPNGARLTTFELTYPRFIHSELMTHRVFSRNAASSRAIPTSKKIDRIRKDMAVPSEWGLNQKGMQSAGSLSEKDQARAKALWSLGGLAALDVATRLDELNVHKQVANRVLEPWDHITVVLSTTKLKNHFLLRLATDPVTGRPLPDPTYFELATKWKRAFDESTPKPLAIGEWHLPYVTVEDVLELGHIAEPMPSEQFDVHELISAHPGKAHLEKTLKMVSAARCARVSYLRQGQGDIAENQVLHDRLVSGGHWAPLEHVATPMGWFRIAELVASSYQSCDWCLKRMGPGKAITFNSISAVDYNPHDLSQFFICMKCAHGHIHSGNFHGFMQYRKEFASEAGGD